MVWCKHIPLNYSEYFVQFFHLLLMFWFYIEESGAVIVWRLFVLVSLIIYFLYDNFFEYVYCACILDEWCPYICILGCNYADCSVLLFYPRCGSCLVSLIGSLCWRRRDVCSYFFVDVHRCWIVLRWTETYTKKLFSQIIWTWYTA